MAFLRNPGISRRWASAIAVIVALAFAAPLRPEPALSQAPGHPTNIDNLVRNFERMAFPEDEQFEDWGTIKRWAKPISAVIIGDGGEKYRTKLRVLLSQLAALTGLEFLVPEADSAATTQIFFSERDWYASQAARSFQRPEQVQCFSNTNANMFGEIQTAFVVIPNDLRADRVAECLAHEIMHTVGFSGHPQRTFYSALGNGNSPEVYTVNDLILIRTLYDQRLTTDMMRAEVLATAREVMVDLLERVNNSDNPLAALAQRQPINWWEFGRPGNLGDLPAAKF
jgi:hypothetical protein